MASATPEPEADPAVLYGSLGYRTPYALGAYGYAGYAGYRHPYAYGAYSAFPYAGYAYNNYFYNNLYGARHFA